MENLSSFYTSNPFEYSRRISREVNIGGIPLGGSHPIRVQSMTNVPTIETEACAQQIVRMVRAGSEYVRLTTPRMEEAKNLINIKKRLKELHCEVPIVADVHFTPDVAEVAAGIVEKVRINPGNYTDRKIIREYTEQLYREALEKTADRLIPLLKICEQHCTALRIGTNHGSLSPRIVSRYGDTPMGMAMSAMEFIEICESYGFHHIVLSMKASNVRIMTESVRIVTAMMDTKGWNYPLHLGVTEAGNGTYGRIKSTAGILPLLYDGIGDTIRVSLTEAPENELPIARLMVQLATEIRKETTRASEDTIAYNPYRFSRRKGETAFLPHNSKAFVISNWEGREKEDLSEADVRTLPRIKSSDELPRAAPALVLDTASDESVLEIRRFFNHLLQQKNSAAVIVRRHYEEQDWERFYAQATADFASLFIEGWGDGLWLSNPHFPDENLYRLSQQILQACGIRFAQAEYIACPSCGRTQYQIEKVLEEIRKRTSHLKNLKIGVMGCIVNGPGEMADADYGFVGCGGGKVSLYKGQKAVYQQIPQEKGIDKLIQLIKENGDWTDAAE